ncbi:MAG: GTP 3',8-cyclase MoaA [Acidimicrobiales bacterium]
MTEPGVARIPGAAAASTELKPTPRAELIDGFGRVAHDLRISITDRCNMRCRYCMPAEGLSWLDRADLLSFEEIERVARVCVDRFGVRSIRLTGGEPTVRADLAELVARLARLGTDLSMTTNGVSLRLLAGDLARAGLRRINISCDSLRRDRFADLTRRDLLPQVIEGIEAAVDAGLSPVKVNAVLMRGVNDDEIVDLAGFGRRTGVVMRFIEFMPLDADRAWVQGDVVSAQEIVATIEAQWPLERMAGRGAAPAERYRYTDAGFAPGGGEIGVVASVTNNFCANCDRIRLTAEGMFRNCLFSHDECDLRAILRGGGSDDHLARAMADEVAAKRAGHGIGGPDFVPPTRTMSQIGG